MSKSRNIKILSELIIYFILLRISSLYLPYFISFLYLLPTISIYPFFTVSKIYLIISLASFPSEISIKYLLFESRILLLIISIISEFFSKSSLPL